MAPPARETKLVVPNPGARSGNAAADAADATAAAARQHEHCRTSEKRDGAPSVRSHRTPHSPLAPLLRRPGIRTPAWADTNGLRADRRLGVWRSEALRQQTRPRDGRKRIRRALGRWIASDPTA